MSPSKRKSSRQDVVAYSDSDENSDIEHQRSHKGHKSKKNKEILSKKKKSHDEREQRKKQESYYRKLSDSENRKEFHINKRNYSPERKGDHFKNSKEEKKSYSQQSTDEEYLGDNSKRGRKNYSEKSSDEDYPSHSSKNRRTKKRPKSSDEEYSKKQKLESSYSKKYDNAFPDTRKEEKNYKSISGYTKSKEQRNWKTNKDSDLESEKDNQNYRYKSHNKEDPRKKRKNEDIIISDDDSNLSFDKDKNKKRNNIDSETSVQDEDVNEKSIETKAEEIEPLSKRQKIVNINMRTGGAYIPPARLRLMQEQIKDKGSEEYQRIAWEALKKSIVGMTNKVNSSNIAEIVPELFRENIIRGRGVLARAVMQAQAASPTFTRVYAALVAIINTKFPEIGELILKRLIIQYKRGFRRNDKTICMTAVRFLAHLLNQEVAHEVLILEIVTHLLENPTEDSIEVAIACLKECGKKMTLLSARGMRAITQRVRNILHEGNVDVRVRYMIEVFFAIQRDGFKDFEIVSPELDLVEEEDKYTHLINLDDAVDAQEMLNVFKFDPEYVENEEKYKSVVNEILGDESDEEGSGNGSDSENEDEDDETKDDESQQIIDMTETNIVCLRRKIYLTVQSSLDFEECAHKLLRLELKPGQIMEMCYMILDCCAQQRTYEKFFGLLAQRFCQLSKIYVEPFTEIFQNSYKTIHRLETNKLRNVAKFFSHLLYTDAISWNVLADIKLNEEETTSSSRIFIKILFQELCEFMGLPKLNERVKDLTLQEAFEGLFPRDHPHNTRFAINFFTSIGLGGLTDELREHLKNMPKTSAPVTQTKEESDDDESSSSSSSSSSSTSSSSSSESDEKSIKRRRKQKKTTQNKKKHKK